MLQTTNWALITRLIQTGDTILSVYLPVRCNAVKRGFRRNQSSPPNRESWIAHRQEPPSQRVWRCFMQRVRWPLETA